MDWDQRFSGDAFLFGAEPAQFVRRQMAGLAAGTRVLSIAEGEGRNAVWLAAQGCAVTAVEPSPIALAKARMLAAERGAEVDWQQCGLEDFDWPAATFDAVLGCFFQFAEPAFRTRILTGLAQALRPGGTIFLHGFSRRQLENTSGGPRQPDQLWTLDLLSAAFPDWQQLRAVDYDARLSEGAGHAGRAALIDFVAIRPGAEASRS